MTEPLREHGRAHRAGLLACRVVLGGVFVAAAVTKIAAPLEFARAVYQYHLLPDWTINMVAVFLPWVELAAGLAVLAVPGLRDASAAVLGLLLIAFAVAIGMNIYRGTEAPCGCFAALGKTPAGWGHLVGDLLLSLMAFSVVLSPPRDHFTSEGSQGASPGSATGLA